MELLPSIQPFYQENQLHLKGTLFCQPGIQHTSGKSNVTLPGLGQQMADVKGLKKVNYDKLPALVNIRGLQNRENPNTTEEAHRKFMKMYPKIFIKEKVALPGIPERRTKGVHSCGFSSDTESHNVRIYVKKIKRSKRMSFGSAQFARKIQGLIKILKKLPIMRSDEEHETVYKRMKLIPDICDQLSDAEMKQLSKTVLTEYWVKGSAVDATQGFYTILKGSASPQTKYYKKDVRGKFVLPPIQFATPPTTDQTDSEAKTFLGIGDCFGTLIPLSPRQYRDMLTIITEDNCEFLKIPSADYLRVKEEIARREQLAKEEVIHGSLYYQNWPAVFISQLTAQLKWKKFPIDHVFVKEGEINEYVGFIKSGCCNVYGIIPALVKRPLGKMVKQMRQVLVGQLQPRESFGEISILLQIPSAYTLKAADPVELGVIEAKEVLALDPAIHMLLLQTVKPPFENITRDALKLKYIQSEIHKEWKHKKELTLNNALFYNGIYPGVGKWVHEHLEFDKNEKMPQESSFIAKLRRSTQKEPVTI